MAAAEDTAADERMLVYVVDDDPAVRRSLCILLGAHGHATHACASAEAFLDELDPERRACVLLDIRMPGIGGMALQARLAALGYPLPVIMLTGHGDVPLAVRAMKEGALDFIEKPPPEAALLAALAEARAVVGSRARPAVARATVADRLARLTVREREVLDELVLGKTNKEIAAAFGISERTVEIHRARIRAKMEARSLADLIMMMR